MFQQLVVSGDLPCTRDEAATLAGIALHVDEAWPDTDTESLRQDNNQDEYERDRLLKDDTSDAKNKRKEIDVSHRTRKMASSRRRGKLTKQLFCLDCDSVKLCGGSKDNHLLKYLPPEYQSSRRVRDLIQEKQAKLWHTHFYDHELKLKQLYIKICKNLPAHNCRLYEVKEIVRGNVRKKIPRLLGISAEKIILLDSKTKLLLRSQSIQELDDWKGMGIGAEDRDDFQVMRKGHPQALTLEFRGSKTWNLSMSNWEGLKAITAALWEVRESDWQFLDNTPLHRDALDFELSRRQLTLRPDMDQCTVHSAELNHLQKIIHFPEEVALLLTRTEYALFNSVSPSYYIRQVTLDLSRSPMANHHPNVQDLIQRFNEVSSWVTHMIITQPTHEDRKMVLSSILRLAATCWSLGSFNAATEILAGLRSEKLRPFWLTVSEMDTSCLNVLSDALLSREVTKAYREAVTRALDMPGCKVVPFFGGFLRDLRLVLMGVPSVVVMPTDDRQEVEFVSEFKGEDRFLTRIGVGGLINMEKMKQSHVVLNDINLFHEHAKLHKQKRAVITEAAQEHYPEDSDDEEEANLMSFEDDDVSDYELDMDTYQPIKLSTDTLTSSSSSSSSCSANVMLVPAKAFSDDLHSLQTLHHGVTAVHWDSDSTHSALCHLRLELDNATLSWGRTQWTPLMRGGYSHNNADAGHRTAGGLAAKYSLGEPLSEDLEEGYIDLSIVKSVTLGEGCTVDLNQVSRRHGLSADLTPGHNCLCVMHGTSLADNHTLQFVMPRHTARVWHRGLVRLVRAAGRIRQQTDRRLQWLKEQYLRLYHDAERNRGPTPAEAIKVFGGRKWNAPPTSPAESQTNSNFKRTPSVAGGRDKKRKSPSSMAVMKDSSPKVPHSNHTSHDTHPDNPPSRDNSHRIKSHFKPFSQNKLDQNTRSDINITKSQKFNPIPVFRPRNLTFNFAGSGGYPGRRKLTLGSKKLDSKIEPITHSTELDLLDFIDLFKSFSLRCRKDLKDVFERLSTTRPFVEKKSETNEYELDRPRREMGLITRNSVLDIAFNSQRKKLCDALAVSSIVQNSAGLDTSGKRWVGVAEMQEFMEEHQEEVMTPEQILRLIQRHEVDSDNLRLGRLSFEGFARYLMDKDNYAFRNENAKQDDEDMDQPLSHYFIKSSHNTYLTGHQLKGESSVELYSQVLLTGCRCVELDCWDGDDGSPIIYHGHTLTTKIPFKAVVEAINKSAFLTSPYPVILSIENHCSVPQQQKMAHIFTSVFGDKLVTKFLFEADFVDDPVLPSPNQLKYRILIKNKKLRPPAPVAVSKQRISNHVRNNSFSVDMVTYQDEYDDEEDEEDEDYIADVKDMSLMRGGREAGEQTTHASQDSLTDLTQQPYMMSNSDQTQVALYQRERSGSLGTRQSSAEGSTTDREAPRRVSQDSLFDSGDTCPPARPGRTISKDSQESSQDGRPRSAPGGELYWHLDEEVMDLKVTPKPHKKKKVQIAQELSDIIIYTQAVKFRGLNTSPTTSVKHKKLSSRKSILAGSSPSVGAMTIAAIDKSELSASGSLQDPRGSCYHMSSLNESKAKQLCRKHSTTLVAHTEKQLMRVYPVAMRIDSSNFNPVNFWAFGIQMVALNYQTDDTPMHLNTAMFEQNGRSGYVLKPGIMRDKNHPLHGRFSALDKDFDGVQPLNVTIQLISGQYVCSQNLTCSPMVEVELIGIPIDCAKHKSKVISRNALNPIWNEVYTFSVTFPELAFVRFTVMDTMSNHISSQRIIPLHCLRPGYRHVRLRSSTNQPLELSTLFIYSRQEEEAVELLSPHDMSALSDRNDRMDSKKTRSLLAKIKDVGDITRWEKEFGGGMPGIKPKRRLFSITVFGVTPAEEYTIIKVTQDTTTLEAVTQALMKASLFNENAADYVLVEDVHCGWEKRDQDVLTRSQRILDEQERVLSAFNKWKGSGKFMLRKKSDRRQESSSSDVSTPDWEWQHQMFLVCVYNVSVDQPYTILQVPMSSTAQDVCMQVMMKARRTEDPRNYVLVEEMTSHKSHNSSTALNKRNSSGRCELRILAADENVYQAQSAWKSNNGKFLLMDRHKALEDTERCPRVDRKRRGNSVPKAAFVKLNMLKFSNLSQKEKSKSPERDAYQVRTLPYHEKNKADVNRNRSNEATMTLLGSACDSDHVSVSPRVKSATLPRMMRLHKSHKKSK